MKTNLDKLREEIRKDGFESWQIDRTCEAILKDVEAMPKTSKDGFLISYHKIKQLLTNDSHRNMKDNVVRQSEPVFSSEDVENTMPSLRNKKGSSSCVSDTQSPDGFNSQKPKVEKEPSGWDMCKCGHAAYWHDFKEHGECLVDVGGYPDKTCDCDKFEQSGEEKGE